MAGQKLWDKVYFVPRPDLPLERSLEWYCRRLIPDLEKWRTEARTLQGDKSTCCDKFLNQILPFFVKVLVQDGIYFVMIFRASYVPATGDLRDRSERDASKQWSLLIQMHDGVEMAINAGGWPVFRPIVQSLEASELDDATRMVSADQ